VPEQITSDQQNELPEDAAQYATKKLSTVTPMKADAKRAFSGEVTIDLC